MHQYSLFLQHCEGQLLTQGLGSVFLSSWIPAGCKSRKRISDGYPGCTFNSNFASFFQEVFTCYQWILTPGLCKIIQESLLCSKALKMPRKNLKIHPWRGKGSSAQPQLFSEPQLGLKIPWECNWNEESREGSENSSPLTYSDLQEWTFLVISLQK